MWLVCSDHNIYINRITCYMTRLSPFLRTLHILQKMVWQLVFYFYLIIIRLTLNRNEIQKSNSQIMVGINRRGKPTIIAHFLPLTATATASPSILIAFLASDLLHWFLFLPLFIRSHSTHKTLTFTSVVTLTDIDTYFIWILESNKQ